ncbi:MAG: chemotaxis protein CheC [Myxococcaceae bacterium]|nr:chemotaxis protein CheC [Myxococcaceae bacterium]
MTAPLARQEDALREVVHLGSAQAASMLARLVGDVGVLVEVPRVVEVTRPQLGWLLGGRDVPVMAATFALEGDVPGALWWVLPMDSAERLGQRLLRRPGVSGPLASSRTAALAEAANIVASAFSAALSTVLGAKVLPSTPKMAPATVEALLGAEGPPETAVLAGFVSTSGPMFSGTLVVLLAPPVVQDLLRRLGLS